MLGAGLRRGVAGGSGRQGTARSSRPQPVRAAAARAAIHFSGAPVKKIWEEDLLSKTRIWPAFTHAGRRRLLESPARHTLYPPTPAAVARPRAGAVQRCGRPNDVCIGAVTSATDLRVPASPTARARAAPPGCASRAAAGARALPSQGSPSQAGPAQTAAAGGSNQPVALRQEKSGHAKNFWDRRNPVSEIWDGCPILAVGDGKGKEKRKNATRRTAASQWSRRARQPGAVVPRRPLII